MIKSKKLNFCCNDIIPVPNNYFLDLINNFGGSDKQPSDDPRRCCLISMLCIPYKILERLLLTRLDRVIDLQLLEEQAGFRRGHSTTQRIIKLTSDIEVVVVVVGNLFRFCFLNTKNSTIG